MISPNRFFAIAVGVLLISASLALPQGSRAADAPGKALVALYQVAPGKHLDFLKWMAAREAVDKEAGMPATQWYMHTNGDSWDFLAIAPALTEAQQASARDLLRRMTAVGHDGRLTRRPVSRHRTPMRSGGSTPP